MTTLNEWGPEFEVRFQIKFNKDDSPETKSVFRFTISNSVYDLDEPGTKIPGMWIHGKPDPNNITLASTIDNKLKDWNLPFENYRVGKYYNVTMKQYQYEVISNSIVFSYNGHLISGLFISFL